MVRSVAAAAAAAFTCCVCGASAFSLPGWSAATAATTRTPAPWRASSSTTMALKGLAKKAKEAEVQRRYETLKASQPDSPVLKQLESAKATVDAAAPATAAKPGRMSEAFKTAPRTLSVVAEYCRVLQSGFVNGIFEPEIMSPLFREGGGAAVSIATDTTTGGCNLDDIRKVAKEQKIAQGSFPSPLPIIARDLIVDEFQICEAQEAGAASVTVSLPLLGKERAAEVMRFAVHLGMEPIVQITSAEEAADAAAIGATIVVVVGKSTAEALELRKKIPAGIVAGVQVDRRSDEGMDEIEDCWLLRDNGYNVIWVSEVLYKGGGDQSLAVPAIIRAIRAKTSLQYGRARALSGKGEGAREYLGTLAC